MRASTGKEEGGAQQQPADDFAEDRRLAEAAE
jgi:hypothetical protein